MVSSRSKKMFLTQRSWARAVLILFWLLAVGLGAATPVEVFAQTATLHGKVSNAQNGTPSPNANVAVTRPGVVTGAVTNPDGQFEVQNLAAGTYTVSVSYVGYEKKIIEKIELQAGENKE